MGFFVRPSSLPKYQHTIVSLRARTSHVKSDCHQNSRLGVEVALDITAIFSACSALATETAVSTASFSALRSWSQHVSPRSSLAHPFAECICHCSTLRANVLFRLWTPTPPFHYCATIVSLLWETRFALDNLRHHFAERSHSSRLDAWSLCGLTASWVGRSLSALALLQAGTMASGNSATRPTPPSQPLSTTTWG